MAAQDAVDPARAGVDGRRRLPALLQRHDGAAEGRHDHEQQLLRAAAARHRHVGVRRDSVNLVAMPLFHIGGSGWATVGQYVGAKSVILRELDPAELVRLFRRRSHPRLRGAGRAPVPAAGARRRRRRLLAAADGGLRRIADQRGGARRAASSCSAASSGRPTGSPRPPVPSSTCRPTDHDPAGPNRHRLRSCGLPGPGVELRIIDLETGPGRADRRPSARSGSAARR